MQGDHSAQHKTGYLLLTAPTTLFSVRVTAAKHQLQPAQTQVCDGSQSTSPLRIPSYRKASVEKQAVDQSSD